MTAPGLVPLFTLLADLASRLAERYPNAPISRDTVQVYTELTLWDRYGITDESGPAIVTSRADVAAALEDLPLDGTQAEYAARIRLAMRGVAI
ncbi:hypothetical protein OG530_19185 [Streptomyces decoyicus]|uniref:hypothetical protein n=1 Tax=Streptomyces decoyicus TaxID=249567 RepID=UPI002E183521